MRGACGKAGADYVEIYDEHYYGLNLDARDLPEGVAVIRGKPPYTVNWPGGLNSSFAGLILQGYHAKWGTEGESFPHLRTRISRGSGSMESR